MISPLTITFDFSDFVFTGIVYIPVTVAMVYLCVWLFLHRKRSALFNLFSYETAALSIVCLAGALAGTIFVHSPEGIWAMLVLSSFFLSFSNAVLGYIAVKYSKLKWWPWSIFVPILLLGFVVSGITLGEDIQPFVEDNGGVNWDLPLYLFLMRTMVYFAGVVPAGIVFWKRFKTSRGTDEKRIYLSLFLLLVFVLLVVVVDFVIEPIFNLHALTSELAILIFVLVLFVVYFVVNEMYIRGMEQRFGRMIEGMQSMVFIIKKNYEITFTNPAVEKLLGYPDKNLKGKKLLDLVFEKDREVLNNNLSDTEFSVKQIEFRILDANQQIVWVASASKMVSMQDFEQGEQTFLIVLNPISEIKELEHKLINALEKAEESNRLKSAFLSNMSHEVRTPLNAVVGFSDLLRYEAEPETKEFYVRLISEKTDQLLNLINDIFDAALLESKQLKIAHSKVALDELFRQMHIDARHSLRLAKKEEAVSLIFPENNKEITIKTDSQRLQQVIAILINNAIKFTQHGMVELGFDANDDGRLMFWVKDSGIGIAPEKRDQIFQLFRQVDEGVSRKYDGAGLGLSIAKKLVDLLGGKMWFESQLRVGTTFFVSFPGEE